MLTLLILLVQFVTQIPLSDIQKRSIKSYRFHCILEHSADIWKEERREEFFFIPDQVMDIEVEFNQPVCV